ncbi:chondroitinase-B domain-containing protein [Pedobacter sp. Du54]|uniref:chondroitinase-B domain-containing protein n=1 Tax=Pedobacter anseongensis TaxID=3133439 RepID=UPI003095C113
MKKLNLSFILSIFLLPTALAATYTVNSEKQFKEIIPVLVPGDEVLIKEGVYPNWSIEITGKGSLKAPICIKSENEGGVTFSGNLTKPVFNLLGSYLILKGINFKNCNLLKSSPLIIITNADHCVITKCTFSTNTAKVQYTPLVVFSGNSTGNQISRCTFTSNVDNQDIQVKITKETSPLHTLIENNVFENKAKVSWKNGNGGECVQVGQDPVLLGARVSKTTVRFNRFLRCNGEPEVVSNKSSSNTYFKNYFEDNDGELVMRGGHDCLIDGNTFKGGSGAIRVNGTGHTIINNEISNIKTAIRLMYGMAKGKTDVGFYIAASGCTLINNKIKQAHIGILIGDSKDADWTGKFDTVRYPSPVMQNIAPFDNKIERNIFMKTEKTILSL